MKLQVKFLDTTRDTDKKNVIKDIKKCGAKSVRPLFPNETDQELAALYTVEYEDPSLEEPLMNLLNRSKPVEFVERMVQRKLIK